MPDWRDATGTDLRDNETHQLQVRGKCDVIDVTLSLDTNIYADGDVLAATQAITGFFLENGGHAYITGVKLQDDDDQGVAMDILFMNAASDIGAENSAAAITDAEGATILAWIDVSTGNYTDWGSFRTAFYKAADSAFYTPGWIEGPSDSTSLWVGAITRGGTPTHTAAGVTLKISVMYP